MPERLTGLALCLVAIGCGDGLSSVRMREPAPIIQVVQVEFVYLAPTVIDSRVRSAHPACVNAVGRTRIHPSWQGFGRADMTAVGTGRWRASFSNVPVGARQSIRINDPNACARDPTGAVTRDVKANSVELTTVVSTPGAGNEAGLSFSVTSDGRVTP